MLEVFFGNMFCRQEIPRSEYEFSERALNVLERNQSKFCLQKVRSSIVVSASVRMLLFWEDDRFMHRHELFSTVLQSTM